MLKRYQVLLDDWIEDYIKLIIEKYELSSSALIRTHLCLGILFLVPVLHPEYKLDSLHKKLQDFAKKASKDALERKDIIRMMSQVLFETRKAVDFRFSKLNKKIE